MEWHPRRKPRNQMKRRLSCTALGLLVIAGFTGCGADDGSTESDEPGATDAPGTIASRSDPLSWRTRWWRRPPVVNRPAPGTGGAPSSSPAPSSSNIDAIIAAAQRPDGSAIPQPSGPGGACPAVVAALGFWSCVTIGDACTFTSNGVVHHCTCNRVDGEGQAPAWSCD